VLIFTLNLLLGIFDQVTQTHSYF